MTTRIFEGQGFRKNFFPNRQQKDEARKIFGEYVDSLVEDKNYERILSGVDQVLLTDPSRTLNHVQLHWGGLDGGPRIREHVMGSDEVTVVTSIIVPSQVRDALGSYTLGGLLLGGVTGAIVGSIFDSYRGPRTTDVSVSFEFGTGLAFFHEGIAYQAVREKRVTLTDEALQRILREAKQQLSAVKKFYPRVKYQ